MKRIFFLVGLILVFLGAGELICHYRFNKTVSELQLTTSDLYYYTDPQGVRHHIPNKVGYERLWDNTGKAEFRINSIGFRGGEVQSAKKPGTGRILMIGDSITLGGRLPENEIFVTKLARKLGSSFEVLNAGMGDIGLQEEEKILERTGPLLKPDLIVLDWYLNDGRPPVGFPEEKVYSDSILQWFHRNAWVQKSYLVGFIYERYRMALLKKTLTGLEKENKRFQWVDAYMKAEWVENEKAFFQMVEQARFDWGDAWNTESQQQMMARIDRIHEWAKKNNARFMVVLFPVHAQVYARFDSVLLDAPQVKLNAHLEAAGVPTLNLLPMLRKEREKQLFYDNCHYTPLGNGLVADALYRFINGRSDR